MIILGLIIYKEIIAELQESFKTEPRAIALFPAIEEDASTKAAESTLQHDLHSCRPHDTV